jgi:hypothetical protein
MPVETSSMFTQVIQDHLDLKQRNASLEPAMPIERYRAADPFDNHPLFKTEEQARLEETMDGEVSIVDEPGVLPWPGDEVETHATVSEDSGLWSKSRDFDWGD